MTITPLEGILIAGFIASVSSGVTKVWANRNFVSCKTCETMRSSCAMREVLEDIREIKKAISAIANRMNLPPEVRDNIHI